MLLQRPEADREGFFGIPPFHIERCQLPGQVCGIGIDAKGFIHLSDGLVRILIQGMENPEAVMIGGGTGMRDAGRCG